jgi:hypothetical protein
MSKLEDTIRVNIPLTIRKRNGRPKILPPEGVQALGAPTQAPHILKALGRAWAWRRKLESGVVATAGELAKIEGVTERFISRTMRLAYLSPDVLERLIIARQPTTLSWNELVATTCHAWTCQSNLVLGR